MSAGSRRTRRVLYMKGMNIECVNIRLRLAAPKIAAAALWACAALMASAAQRQLHVDFDASLTNTTDWVYESMGHSSLGYSLSSNNSVARSERFPFLLTSVSVLVKPTDSSNRNLTVAAYDDDGGQVGDVQTFSLEAEVEQAVDVDFALSGAVRSFTLSANTASGKGFVYVLSADIYGESIVDMPQNVEAYDVYRDRFSLKWENAEGTLSNAVEVLRVAYCDFSADWSGHWDFSCLSNDGGSAIAYTNQVRELFSGLDGERLYLPAKSSGILQVGTEDACGLLSMGGVDVPPGASLAFRAMKKDSGSVMGVDAVSDGMTNAVGSVTLATNMAWHVLSLDGVPPSSQIVLHSCTNTLHGRVLLECVGIATGVAPAHVETNVVASLLLPKRSSARVMGLEPQTEYLARVKAVGAGEASGFSPPCAVCTTDERKRESFSIRLR